MLLDISKTRYYLTLLETNVGVTTEDGFYENTDDLLAHIDMEKTFYFVYDLVIPKHDMSPRDNRIKSFGAYEKLGDYIKKCLDDSAAHDVVYDLLEADIKNIYDSIILSLIELEDQIGLYSLEYKDDGININLRSIKG